MEKPCNCKKNKVSDKWPEGGDFGDNFLSDSTYYLINSIKRFIKSPQPNETAYFNLKLEESFLDNFDIENTEVDYSYLQTEDDTLIEHQNIILEEEKEEEEKEEEEKEEEESEKEESEKEESEKEESEKEESEKEEKLGEDVSNSRESYKTEIESYLNELK